MRRKPAPTQNRRPPTAKRGSMPPNNAAAHRKGSRAPVPSREFSLYDPTPTPRELFADEELSDGRQRRSRGPAVKDEQKQRLEYASLQTLAHDGETAVLTGKAKGMLVVEQGAHKGTHVDLSSGRSTIGRSSKCSLALRLGSGISRNHAQVTFIDGLYYLEDLGSRNGTVLNGHIVEGQEVLRDRDLIEVSQEQIRFYGPMPEGEDTELPPDASIQAAIFDQKMNEELTPQRRKRQNISHQKRRRKNKSSVNHPVVQVSNEDVGARIEAALNPKTTSSTKLELNSHLPTALPAELPVKRGRNIALLAFGALVGLFLAMGLVVGWDATFNDGLLLDEWLSPAQKTIVAQKTIATPQNTIKKDEEELQINDIEIGGLEKATIKPQNKNEKRPPLEQKLQETRPKNTVQKNLSEMQKSTIRGKINQIKITVGQKIDVGTVILTYRKKASSTVMRKLKSLRAEEKDFKVYAQKGNAMAKESLREVQSRIRGLERKQKKSFTEKATKAGIVQNIIVKAGQQVQPGTILFELKEVKSD